MASGEVRDHIVAYFEERHKLIEPAALDLLVDERQPLVLSQQLIDRATGASPFVTREMVAELLTGRSVSPVPPAVRDATTERPESRRPVTPAPSFVLLREGFAPPAEPKEPLSAYHDLFASRYRTLSRLLKGRPELTNLRPIAELARADGTAAVIGMIRDVRQTSERHHLILSVEDESGATELLVPRDSPAVRGSFLSDEVVGFRVALPRERGRLPRVTAVERPDVSATRALGRSGVTRRVVLLSDLHVGSRSFLHDAWSRLAAFLQGKGPREDLAREVAHVVVAGDLVDGIGVYPHQERDLEIEDVFEQYAELGRRLSELPSHLNIVIVPGNHDAVCPSEPQPRLPEELERLFPPNVRSLGNPSTFSLDGVVLEAYHGRSFDDLIPAIPGASYSRPTEVMKRMLAMRHLAPIYGGRTPLTPLVRDGLVIDPAPDILVTGHVHTYGVDRYRGTLLVNASAWQAETEYQRMRNISPVPARAALVDLATLRLDTVDCSSSETVAVGVAP